MCRFASIAKLAGEQLKPYVAQLVPKLYRYQHDPNPRVRDAMIHIWRALIDNPKQAVDEHFAAIVKEVLTEMGGRLWRNREAACSALSDLVQVGARERSRDKQKAMNGCCLSCRLNTLSELHIAYHTAAELFARRQPSCCLLLEDQWLSC